MTRLEEGWGCECIIISSTPFVSILKVWIQKRASDLGANLSTTLGAVGHCGLLRGLPGGIPGTAGREAHPYAEARVVLKLPRGGSERRCHFKSRAVCGVYVMLKTASSRAFTPAFQPANSSPNNCQYHSPMYPTQIPYIDVSCYMLCRLYRHSRLNPTSVLF